MNESDRGTKAKRNMLVGLDKMAWMEGEANGSAVCVQQYIVRFTAVVLMYFLSCVSCVRVCVSAEAGRQGKAPLGNTPERVLCSPVSHPLLA